MKQIHLIAIGGSAMHNLALALQANGVKVSGSDDEIYDPAKSRLEKAGLLPSEMGWVPDRITKDLDLIILGMHARADNPELAKAKSLNLPILSYPEFIYEHSKNKQRIVIGGSHGKTSTTAMILHVFHYLNIASDYLVGAQLDGFQNMVALTQAPRMVIEGDEYLSSTLQPIPKFHFYKPHAAILTGIAWDHINVFPTFENYVKQFERFMETLPANALLCWYKGDRHLEKLVQKFTHFRSIAYDTPPHEVQGNITYIVDENKKYPLKIFGKHNLQNLEAARLICENEGIDKLKFFEAMASFTGAAKRLEQITATENSIAYLDFAHAPSKAKATVSALKNQYPNRPLLACLELHTFSSLNKKFLEEYHQAMDLADHAAVFFSAHTLKMKKLPALTKSEVQKAFGRKDLMVFNNKENLSHWITQSYQPNTNVLMMSSGNFGGMDIKAFCKQLLS